MATGQFIRLISFGISGFLSKAKDYLTRQV
jgi:hypothetical protein